MKFDMDVVRMSSKGQIVIPREMRNDLKEGDKLVVIRDGDELIMRKASKKILEDLEFARRTEEAWKRHDRGEFKTMDADDFMKMIRRRLGVESDDKS